MASGSKFDGVQKWALSEIVQILSVRGQGAGFQFTVADAFFGRLASATVN
jgi:hypothetical protein